MRMKKQSHMLLFVYSNSKYIALAAIFLLKAGHQHVLVVANGGNRNRGNFIDQEASVQLELAEPPRPLSDGVCESVDSTRGSCVLPKEKLLRRAAADTEVTLKPASFARIVRAISGRVLGAGRSRQGDHDDAIEAGGARDQVIGQFLSGDEEGDHGEDYRKAREAGRENSGVELDMMGLEVADGDGASDHHMRGKNNDERTTRPMARPFRVVHVGPYHLRESPATAELYQAITERHDASSDPGGVELVLVEANPFILNQLRNTIRIRFPSWTNSTRIVQAAIVPPPKIMSQTKSSAENERASPAPALLESDDGAVGEKTTYTTISFFTVNFPLLYQSESKKRDVRVSRAANANDVEMNSMVPRSATPTPVPTRIADAVGVQAYSSATHLVQQLELFSRVEDEDVPKDIPWADYVVETRVPVKRSVINVLSSDVLVPAAAPPGVVQLDEDRVAVDILIVDTPNSVDIVLDFLLNLEEGSRPREGAAGGEHVLSSHRTTMPRLIRLHWFWGLGYANFADFAAEKEPPLRHVLRLLTKFNYEVLQHREFFYAIPREM
ncbi:unnamed protein product [Amoebophrya sp. A120]|nr:unnamed protein product [Amoebophrya sp. A120]|eukprot:GSA120T00001675001.1